MSLHTRQYGRTAIVAHRGDQHPTYFSPTTCNFMPSTCPWLSTEVLALPGTPARRSLPSHTIALYREDNHGYTHPVDT